MTVVVLSALKDPNAQSDYLLDWSIWLPVGDTIATSVWIAPSDLTVVSSSNTTTTSTVWLKGGVAGQVYIVTNRITTASTPNRIDDRSIQIQVDQR
jgi:hypothetical protein